MLCFDLAIFDFLTNLPQDIGGDALEIMVTTCSDSPAARHRVFQVPCL
jgi:hypothetical protein